MTSGNYLLDYKNINTPEDLLNFMSKYINYGFISNEGKRYIESDKFWNRDWYKKCIIQSGSGILKTKLGTCWDQVELERKWFKEHNYEFKTIFFWFNLPPTKNRPTHTILAFKNNNKWFWFEHSFFSYRGIYEYDSLKELINDVRTKHLKSAIKKGVANEKDLHSIEAYIYAKPKANLNVTDYLNHVKKS